MMNTNNLNICWEWWGRTSRDLHWDDFVFCKDWNCLFPGLSLQQKMSCVKGTLLPNHFSTNVFRVLLRVIRVATDNREWQKKRQEYNILDVIFQKLLTQNVLHESSISKCACIKEIVHQQNLTESHLNIKWQKTCLMWGMKNGWHLFMIFSFIWTLSSPQITQRR